jgi:hypothetical protein
MGKRAASRKNTGSDKLLLNYSVDLIEEIGILRWRLFPGNLAET